MHELQELVDVVTRNKVKSIRLLEPLGEQPPDMLHDFYGRLANHEFANDEEAAQFYGYTSASDRGYRKQRDKLRERLYNSAVFIDVNSPKFNDAQKAFYTCLKNQIVIRTLLGRYARKSAIELIKKTLKYSLKFEFSEVNLELFRFLRNHHASKTGSKYLYKKYADLFKKYKIVVNDEDEAFEFYDHLSLLLVRNTVPNKEYFKYARKAINVLENKNTNTFKFIVMYKMICCNYALHSYDYRGLIRETKNALQRLRNKNISNQFIGLFTFLQLIAYIQLGKGKEVEDCFLKCRTILEDGTVRWYNAHDQYMIYLFRSGHYKSLYKTFLDVVQISSFKLQTQKRKETWKMYEAYIYYLFIKGKIGLDDGVRSIQFSIKKFLNEVPMFSMDKGGYNIPIVVIQNLLLIELRQYEELTTRTSALEKYCKRYIKRNDNFRSHYFFKLLLLVPKFNFDRDVIEAKAKPYLKKLESVPLSDAKQSFEIEIIPYETLWEYVLESLED